MRNILEVFIMFFMSICIFAIACVGIGIGISFAAANTRDAKDFVRMELEAH